MVPTFGAEPVMGTNPLAFAAPARRNPPFSARHGHDHRRRGKVKVHKLNHKPLPSGWVVDGDGKPVTDDADAFSYVFDKPEGGITPLGGTRDVGQPQGLRARRDGAHPRRAPVRRLVLADPNRTQKPSDPHNIGHFFLAIDPRAFRAEGEFEEDLDQVIDVLHGAKRADPDQPVLVAGDPEMATRAERLAARRADSGRLDGAAPRSRAARRRAVRPRRIRASPPTAQRRERQRDLVCLLRRRCRRSPVDHVRRGVASKTLPDKLPTGCRACWHSICTAECKKSASKAKTGAVACRPSDGAYLFV